MTLAGSWLAACRRQVGKFADAAVQPKILTSSLPRPEIPQGSAASVPGAVRSAADRSSPSNAHRPAGIDEPELRADFAPEGGAALARTLCHNVTETRLSLGRAQCLENLALEPHAMDYTRAAFLCSASLVGTG